MAFCAEKLWAMKFTANRVAKATCQHNQFTKKWNIGETSSVNPQNLAFAVWCHMGDVSLYIHWYYGADEKSHSAWYTYFFNDASQNI